MNGTIETTEDYLARLNMEGKRNVWQENHYKIGYIFNKSKKYLKSKSSVCEIGIGDGYLLRLLINLGLEVTGIDKSNYLVEKLRVIFEDEKREINLLQHDISEDIDYENTFDVIFCIDVLEHVQSLDKAIDNIKKCMKNTGFLVAMLPWKENLDRNMVKCPYCHHEFHRIGHFHSFYSYNDIFNLLGNEFQILEFGFVPTKSLRSKIKNFLKRTIFRKTFCKDNLPNFQITCFFIAEFLKTGKGHIEP